MTVSWCDNVLSGQVGYEIWSTTHTLSKYLKENGGNRAFWRAIAVWKSVCFWPFSEFTRARNFLFKRARINSYQVENDWKFVNLLKNVPEFRSMQKNETFIFRTCCVRAWRARGRVRAENVEMLRMTWNMLSLVQVVIFEHLKKNARIFVRSDAHVRVSAYIT